MTKQHFELIARVVNDELNALAPNANSAGEYNFAKNRLAHMVSVFAETLAGTNPMFDAERFSEACGFPIVKEEEGEEK